MDNAEMNTNSETYFTRFLASRMHRDLLEGYDGLSTTFRIAFRDTGKSWALTLERGRICSLIADSTDPCRVVFHVDEPVFLDLIAGRISPQNAFFQRRTDIQGNWVEGMKLARILGLFFDKHPYPGQESET
jgi:hypothetical protein